MNTTSRTILSLGLTLLTLGTASAREMRIAVVDMRRVFDEYHRTIEMRKKLTENRDLATGESEESRADYRKSLLKFEALRKEVLDPALSAQLREKKREESNELRQRLMSMERSIKETDEHRQRQLQREIEQMRRVVLADIRKVLDEIAKSQNYDLVIDKSGESFGGVPLLLYYDDKFDLTDEVIERVNAAHPEKGEGDPAE